MTEEIDPIREIEKTKPVFLKLKPVSVKLKRLSFADIEEINKVIP